MVKISVIIPTCNDERYISKCLETLKNQKFNDFEIIIVDGHSKDKTVEIAKKYGAKVIYESIGTRAGACNIGAEAAKGEVLVFTDGDAYFPENWLMQIWDEFDRDRKLSVYGGEDILEDGTHFEMANFQLDLARIDAKVEPRKRVRGCNSSYRKEIFSAGERFNEKLSSMEEYEFHHRLAARGYTLKFNPKMYVYHRRRDSVNALFKQFFRNGIGTVNALRVNKEIFKMRYIAPFLSIPAVIIWILLLKADMIYAIGAALLYLLTLLVRSFLIVNKTRGWRYFFTLLLILAIREMAFSIGLLYGIFNYKKPAKKM